MALTDENGGGFNVSMPVAPAYGVPYGGNNGGLFGGGDSWLGILFLIALLNGGWGGFGGFGGGYGAMMGAGMWGMADGFGLYPWLNNSQNINNGFRDQQISTQINGLQNTVTSGFGDVQLGIAGVNQNICQTGAGITNAVNQGFASTSLGMCQGFNGVNAAINGAQNALAQQMYTNQISDLERSFAAQTASTQGFNGVQAQLAQCCCDNRLATAQTQNIVQVEAAASRASASADTQKILDKLCALELDGVKGQLAQAQRENVALQNAVNMATMQANQTAQTAQILAGQAAEIDGVYNRLKNCPVGTYNVCNPLTPSGGCPSCAGY